MADASAYDSAVDTLFPQSDTPEPSAPPTPEAAPAGGDTPAVDKYDAAVSSLLEGQKNAQKAAIVQNSQSGVVPSRQALAVELAKTYGMPVEVAYENADTLKERPHVDVEKILKNSPYLAQTLADPAKGPAAMPDADVLSEIEQRFRDAGPNADFSSTFKKGLASYMWKHLFEGPAQGKANDLSPEDSAAATQARVDAAAKKPAEDAQAITQANLDRQWRMANDPVYAASQQAYLPESGKVVDLYNPNSDLTKTAARANIAKDVEALTYAKDNPVTKTAFGDAIDTVFNGLGMTAANAMKWGGEVSDLIPSSIKPRLALAAPMLAPIFAMGGEKDIHGKGALTRAADATAKTLDTMFPGDKGRANDLSHQVLAGGVSTLPYMLGGGIGEAVGLPAAAVAAILGAVTEGGSQAFDAEQHNATYWQKMLALGVGTIAGLSEAIPVENAFHYLEEIPFRSWAVKTAVKGTTGGMAEGVQEMGQTGVEDLTAKLTYDKSRAVIGNMLQAGGPAFLIGMVFGGLGHAAQAHAEQARDNLIKIGDLIQKAKLSQISPGMMSDFVKNVGHDVQVKPEALETLFQENGGEQQRAVYEQFRARIDEAKNNNAEVTISASEIPALRGVTSELGWSKFSDDVRFPSKNPTDRTFTVNEAIGFRKTMDSVVEHLGKEGDNAIPPSPVYTSVREQLVKAGQSPQAAHFMGLIWENAFRTAAARSKDGKLDPVDFFNSMGVKISNSALTAQEMAPQLDALRKGALTSELAVDEDGDPVVPPSPLNESYDTVFTRILNAEGYRTPAQQGTAGDAGGGSDLGTVPGQPDAGSRPGRPQDTIVPGADGQATPAGQVNGGPKAGPSSSETTLNQTVRGSISFGPGRDAFHITLTGQANLSTFLHESGHFFLEMLQKLVESGNASEQQAADLEKWRSWMGLKPGEKIEVRHHEMAARAFEAYFMEGKAPSAELQGAFQRFKGWLTMIYRQLRGLNVNLTDEVRGVMDRLLATDDAISQARADIGWRGAPMSQEATGFTDAEYKTYVDNWNKASDAQSQDADARVMLEAAREIQRAWRDEKIATTKALEEKLAQSRGWIAWKLLTKGERIDEFAPGRTSLKIDPDTIPAEWRGDAVGMTTDASSGGMPLDVVGEMLGFKSGEEMLSLIAGTRAAERAIPGQVRAEMEAKHGKMDDVQIALEAARAVHNKPTMDVLLTEYRAMGEKVGSKTPSNLNALLAAQAEEKVSGLTRRQLDPAKWRRAELKSAREAGAKAAKGDAMGAFIAKRQQLIASHMAKASLDAIDRIDKIKDYLSRFQTNRLRSQLGKAGDMYLDGVDQILEGIQFKDVSLKAIKARKSLDDLVREAEKNGEAVFVSDETKALLGRKNYTELTLQELESVHDAVKNLWTIAKAVTAVRKGNEKIALEAALTDITKETEALLPARKQRDHLNKTMIDEKMEGLSAFHAGLLKIEFVLDWLGKTAHSLVYQPITDAHFAAWKLHQEVTAPFMAKLQNMPKEQRARWNTKFKFLDYPLELKGGNVWAIALNLGNEGNKAKLLAGYGWTEAQVKDELNKILTKEDWDLVQEAWDTIDKLWPQMAAVVKGATGLEPPKIVASPVETPHGTYRGGYYPVVYDTAIDSRMEEKLDSAISPEEMFSKRFTSFAIGNGFTKGRTNNTGKLLFSPDVIPQHLGEVIHYITHYEAVKQADRVMRSPVFKALVRKHLGDAVYAEMKKWLKNVATNKTDSQERRADAGDKMFRWVRGSAQLASLGLNIKSALKQPLGIAATLDAIKFKHWAIGIKEAWLSPNVRQNWREAFAKSKELGPLLKEYDRDMAAISRAYSEKIGNRALEGAYNLAFTPISVMQSVANVAAWRGAYSQATQEGMSESDAINFADKVVRQTQGGAAMKDLSGMQRGGEGAKFFTMFYSYYGVLYNRMSDVQIRERGAKNLHRKAGRYAVLLLLGEALNLAFDRYLWDQMDPPDKADDSPFYTRLALNTVESAVNTLPIARDVYAIGAAIAQHQRARPPAAFGAILRAEQGAEAIISHFREGKPITRAKARNIAAFAGVMTNTPAVGVWRAIDLLFGEEIFGK